MLPDHQSIEGKKIGILNSIRAFEERLLTWGADRGQLCQLCQLS